MADKVSVVGMTVETNQNDISIVAILTNFREDEIITVREVYKG